MKPTTLSERKSARALAIVTAELWAEVSKVPGATVSINVTSSSHCLVRWWLDDKPGGSYGLLYEPGETTAKGMARTVLARLKQNRDL